MSSRIQLKSSNQGGTATIEKVVTCNESGSVQTWAGQIDAGGQKMSGSRCSPSPWLQLIPEGLQICGIRRTWRSCPSPDHKAASCARDPGELMCHRQLARSLPRVERRCRFLLMAGRPRERSAAALSIVPIWPPVYYYLARSILFQGTNHSADLQKLLIRNGTWAPWGF